MVKAGVTFACRYLSTPGNPKNLTAEECRSLFRAGIDVVTVFETTAMRALDGRTAGAHDAYAAEQQLKGLPAPGQQAVVYFAVDFDARPQDQEAINDYLRGAASVLGAERVGVYGGYWVVKRCLEAGIVVYAWQTYAWSGDQWHPGAQLRQWKNGVKLDGCDVDLDHALKADFGQWHRVIPEAPRYWAWLAWTLAEGPYKGYARRDPLVRPKSAPRVIPAAWWRRAAAFVAARRKWGRGQV